MLAKPIIHIEAEENAIEKIFLLNHIEEFLYFFLKNPPLRKELETMTGEPILDKDIDVNDQELINSHLINNYFKKFENTSRNKEEYNSKVLATAMLIYEFIENKLTESNKEIKGINFKKHSKILNNIIIEWFKQNTQISKDYFGDSSEFFEKNKKTKEVLEELIPEAVLEKFFKVRGDIKLREETLLPLLSNIVQAVKKTSLLEVAQRLNLKYHVLKHFIKHHSQGENIAPIEEIDQKIILEIIAMLDNNVPLTDALSVANEKYNIRITYPMFWQRAKKINPKINSDWYLEKLNTIKKQKEKEAIKIIGEDVLKYLKTLPEIDPKALEPYLEKIEQALLASSNTIICSLLGKHEHFFRGIFNKYKPGWWAENMTRSK